MLLRALLLSLLTALALSSCANEAKQEEAQPASGGAYTIPVETLEKGQKIAQEAVVDCGADCSPSVGLIAYATPDNAGQCTAFLVSEDIVATNSHCIPNDLREPGSSCKDRLWMHFAKDGAKETSIGCDQVIFDSKNNKGFTDKPDYAYVKLAKASTRPALRITRDGLPEGASIFLQKVNPVKGAGRMMGKQERVQCRTVQNSNSLLSYFHPFSPTAFFSDCLVIKGNSGSPVLAQDGSVRGIVFAFQSPADVKEVVANNKSLRLKEGLSNLNFAANFACLRGPDGSEADRIPVCADHAKNFRDHQVKRALAETAELTSQIEAQMAAISAVSEFGWTARYEKAGGVANSIAYAGVKASPVPKCLNAGAAEKFSGEQAVDLPQWVVTEEYDRYVRGTTALGTPERVKAKIKVFTVGANEFTVLITAKDSVRKIENLARCD